jgi:drug/metabolite transporter (DMT)-like permease
LLAIAAAVAGGISFLQSRKLAAPKVATATGAIFLACALVSLVLLAFVRETRIDLPWMAQRILFAVILTVSMAAFTLAAVHHLQAARGRLLAK